MAIKTKQEILDGFRALSDNSDAAITLLEDLQDTMTDFENRTADQNDWKTKYEQNDSEWRKRYTDRFFEDVEGSGKKQYVNEKPKALSYEDLFKEG